MPPEQVFASFDGSPLAAASIGQAHAATLPDGTEVVVKVRRPGGSSSRCERDLEILQNVARAREPALGASPPTTTSRGSSTSSPRPSAPSSTT